MQYGQKEKSDNDSNDVELDDILQDFKLSDRYYTIYIIVFGLASLSNTLFSTNYVYTVRSVKYSCHYEGCDGYSLNSQIDPTSSECVRYLPINDNAACSVEDYHRNVTAACDRWEYDNPSTFVAEFDLGCQDWKRTLIGSMHSFGYMLGLLICGPLSDRFGRKIQLVVIGTLGGVFGVSRAFITSYWLYVAFEILEAMFGDPCSAAYTLSVEMAPKNKRILFLSLLGIFHGAGYGVAGLYMWLIPYWRHFLLVLYVPALLFILFAFYLEESPRWLLIKGRRDDAVKIIRNLARKNNRTINEDKLNRLKIKEETLKSSLSQALKLTLSSQQLLLRFVVCVIWWMSTLFMNYGSTITLASIKGNIYLNYILQSVADILAIVLSGFIQKYLKRKMPLMCVYLLAGIFFIAQAFLNSSIYSWLPILLYLGGRLMTSILFNIVYLYTAELFPTYTRNTMHAVCSSVGRVGSIIAPQTPLLLKYWSGLPSLLFGGVALLASFVTFFVPDAGEEALPDNVIEAENFGSDKIIIDKINISSLKTQNLNNA